MKKALKKGLASILALSMVLSMTLTSTFAVESSDPEFDYTNYDVGVTVEEDENSPTGYNAIFVFDEASVDAEDYGLIDVDKVQVYSDGMYLFNYDEQPAGEYLDPANAHTPHEFEVGMYPAGGDTDSSLNAGKIAYYEDMVEFEDGKWGAVIPLTSGATYYNYRLTDSEGTKDTSYIDDPANPAMVNEASGVSSRSSMVYVPYSDMMGDVDRSVENPREDGQTGTVEFVSYEGTRGSDRYLAVYLPYGYDADREEPYNVLYMSHGWQSESLGSELRWMNECAVPNIMDNLEGDFIVVTMNNQDYYFSYSYAWPELQAIVTFMEENYNVGTQAANRALAGLSYGGYLTSQIYVNNPDAFGYFGIWSYANVKALTDLDENGKAALARSNAKLSIGSGDWDYMLPQTDAFAAGLDEIGVEYDVMSVPGSHDWRTWQAMFAVAVENFFFNGPAPVDYTAYEPGVTVEADEYSPTGYTATFIYEEQDMQYYADLAALEGYSSGKGSLGDSTEITKVELYSDCMMLFDPDDQTAGSINGATGYQPSQFAPGLYPAGGNGATTYTVEMVEFADGMWGVQIPLTSGATVYNFTVYGDADGAKQSRLDDPNNPTMWNDETGIHSLSSLVYVPYDEAKMGDGEWADRSVENPREDGQTGTVQTVAYTGAAGDLRGLSLYLPYGYDEERAEPYNVLYLSHGASGDPTGNDMRWMNEGAVANIMDNLEGDFVVVVMNNQDLGWNYDKIWAEQELIMAYMEENYNVADYAAGRAYAGLSMGGITTSNMFLNHADQFAYYGVWSAANSSIAAFEESLKTMEGTKYLLFGAGMWDYGRGSVLQLQDKLAALGITGDFYEVPGAHDWETWQMIYAYAVENFFFKGVDYSAYEPGVTVEADENSPTGYTATFIYKEQESYSKTPGDVVKVELYSDTFWLFDPEGDMELGKTPVREDGVAPDQFVPGLVPAGGDGGKNGYYGQMKKIGEDLWALQVPLTSGAFPYNFQVYDAEGNMTGRLDDPSNPKMKNEATGISSYSSMVYIPYNEKTMGKGEWADRSVELPIADESKKGTLETISYTGGAGDKRGLAVYLPAGYDADRAEPYKVLYLSHGLSSDQYGNELRWMSEGVVPNIMDNLVADGKAEPFVVVTMNNMDYKFFNSTFSLWDPAKLWVEQELIMDHIEANYNVCDTAEGRAYAGLSMGGYTASSFYLNHAEEFAYFGIWSFANTADVAARAEYLQGLDKQPEIMLAAGMWDYLRAPVVTFGEQLKELGINSEYYEVPAAHDWKNWHLTFAYAAENFFFKGVDYSAYEPGVTVEADENSPTGFTATFVYEEQEEYAKTPGDVVKVELYSDTFWLFDPAGGTVGKTPTRADGFAPDQFRPGLVPAGGSGGTNGYYGQMQKIGDGLWAIQVPLTSGAFPYNFQVYDAEGNMTTRLDDPNNPKMYNEATGIGSVSSMVYVPYNEDTMGKGEWADSSVELPIADESKKGTVETIAYTGAAGDLRGLAVYLPAGYDADRAEPYKVLYLSHGASSDKTGNELRWMNEGAVPNIMDNLIAEGKAEPFVVVTMNNQDLGRSGFDYTMVWAEQELIMAHIEENYNVCDTAEGRAFAGLSMGGLTTSRMYLNHGDEFSYYGIWSYAQSNISGYEEYLENLEGNQFLMFGAGKWDYLRGQVVGMRDNLAKIGIMSEYYEVPAAHDWKCWHKLYAYAVENFFWKGVDYTAYEPGVTVEADENSPTGYTATFIYEEQESYNNLAEDIVKVELYSDCFWLFDPEGDLPLGKTPSRADGVSPEEYKPGLVPAGGSGGTNGFYADMYEFAPGMWALQVPLTSGAFVYNFQVTDSEGRMLSRLDDPNNPKMWNTATNIGSLSSMVYVPYNRDTMGNSKWADRSVELPIADETKKGTVETIAYTGAASDLRGLAVYLPAGYDADRTVPYKVLYLSHGASSDKQGNELRWMSEGAVPNIMDNLIAEGKAEPFVVVTMNNQDISFNFEKVWAEQELIMAHIEENYNVCDTAEGRAFAGLSMGGLTTSRMYLNHGDEFSYYGIWSYAQSNITGYEEYLKNLAGEQYLMFGAGMWDYLRGQVVGMRDNLAKIGITGTYYEVPGAHDWETWQLLYAYAVENFFWKGQQGGSGGSGGGGGSSATVTPQPPKTEITFSQFGDLDANAWYAKAVEYVLEKGIMTGVADDEFAPDTALTRAMVVQMLWALEGKPVVNDKLTFADVAANAWYAEAVRWAAAEGIVSGYSAEKFGPNDAVTREQMAVMLAGYARYKGVDVTGGADLGAYADADGISDWAMNGMKWACGEGILSGKTGGYLDPTGTATRMEAAQMLMKFSEVLDD